VANRLIQARAYFMQIGETDLFNWLANFIWPFFRITALFVVLPIFSGHLIPVHARIILAAAITLIIAPLLPSLPHIPLFSLSGVLLVTQQVLIGVAMGFILQFVFAAVVFGGQTIAYNMGLGFASMIDPQTGVQVPVIAQFYLLLATLLFLSIDGHLLMIGLVIDSFTAIPIGNGGLTTTGLLAVVSWSSRLFAVGVLLSLPIMSILLLVNLGFGVASRAAPQLNIFSVGFPISLFVGIVLIGATLPNLLTLCSRFMHEGYRVIEQLLGKSD
jgi:flagellar biosynthetic protein FliR